MSESVDGQETPTGSNGRVTYRDVTDMMSRLEKEMKESITALKGQIEGYMQAHAAIHAAEQQQMQHHLITSAVMGERGQDIAKKQEGQERELQELRDWRSEMRGMTTLVKFLVGTSLVSFATGLLTLYLALTKIGTT